LYLDPHFPVFSRYLLGYMYFRIVIDDVIGVTGCIGQRFWRYGLYWTTFLVLPMVSMGIFALYWTTSLMLRVILGDVIDVTGCISQRFWCYGW